MAPRQRMSPPPPDEDTSSSPTMSERKALDKEDSMSLSESEIARDQHDIFNLFALLPVIVLTMANYDWDKVSRGYDPETSWTGNYFMEYWSATILYFFIDLLWVARVPICVKSPGVIIKHHFIAIFYLIAPLAWPRFRWFMGACLSVEVNTWFLIARRVVYKRNYSNTLGGNLISICFYLSWIIIRCLVYPGLLYMFLHMAEEGIRETGTIMHWELLFVPIHFFLCLLNLKWTYDLFQPMFVRWVDKEKGPIQGVASGL